MFSYRFDGCFSCFRLMSVNAMRMFPMNPHKQMAMSPTVSSTNFRLMGSPSPEMTVEFVSASTSIVGSLSGHLVTGTTNVYHRTDKAFAQISLLSISYEDLAAYQQYERLWSLESCVTPRNDGGDPGARMPAKPPAC